MAHFNSNSNFVFAALTTMSGHSLHTHPSSVWFVLTLLDGELRGTRSISGAIHEHLRSFYSEAHRTALSQSTFYVIMVDLMLRVKANVSLLYQVSSTQVHKQDYWFSIVSKAQFNLNELCAHVDPCLLLLTPVLFVSPHSNPGPLHAYQCFTCSLYTYQWPCTSHFDWQFPESYDN